jgi:AraC-like DNA-binding protein
MKPAKEKLPIIFPTNLRFFTNHRSDGASHWHEEIEIIYVTSGTAIPLLELKPIELCSGDILFVNSNELHSGSNGPYENQYYCFHINKNFFCNGFSGEHLIFENVIRDRDCAALLDKVIECSRQNDTAGKLLAGQLLYKFFGLMAERYLVKTVPEEEYKKVHRHNDRFNDIVKYIEDHFAEPLTVLTVAEQFYITPSYLSHFFKKHSGKSVMAHLSEIRVIKAKLLLEQTDLPIGSIAGKVGFDDINYFSRKFKQFCGVTPGRYRNNFK